MLTKNQCRKTPLYLEHLARQGRMVSFGGWHMPVQYEGILSEYQKTRQQATLFDTSHMSEFLIQGDAHEIGLDSLVSCRLADIPCGHCRYGMFLNHEGGVIDDLVIFRIDKKEWMIVANGGTIDKDEIHLKTYLRDKTNFRNISFQRGKIDIQGPLSLDILQKYISDIERLSYYPFDFFDFMGIRCLIARMGYTGELGYEIYCPWDKTVEVWKELLSHRRVSAAGLGARDVLRLEMGYPLYGQDLDDSISPLEAGLSKFVDFNKDFMGKDALMFQKEQGLKRQMIFFVCHSRRSPRHNHKIYLKDFKEIGIVTSGSFSPSLEKGIGIGLVERKYLPQEGYFLIGEKKNPVEATMTKRPFYKKGTVHN